MPSDGPAALYQRLAAGEGLTVPRSLLAYFTEDDEGGLFGQLQTCNSFRSLLICTFSNCVCPFNRSTRATGNSASARAPKSHCDKARLPSNSVEVAGGFFQHRHNASGSPITSTSRAILPVSLPPLEKGQPHLKSDRGVKDRSRGG
jgi:hypothetical protein